MDNLLCIAMQCSPKDLLTLRLENRQNKTQDNNCILI